MKIEDIQIRFMPRDPLVGLGWVLRDGRGLLPATISCYIDGVKCSLTAQIKNGQEGKPLIVGFPGYLSDADGSGNFFDSLNEDYTSYTVVTFNDREGFSPLALGI